MPQLHELLAVEGELSSITAKVQSEAGNTFAKKPDTYRGFVRAVNMLDPTRSGEDTTEDKPVGDTVQSKLEYVAGHTARYWDALLQKEASNQTARADLIVDGVTIATGLPATFLLGLETRLGKLRDMYAAIPTLDPGMKWDADPAQGAHIYRTEPKVNFKTEKVVKSKVLYDATDKHPAQIEKWTEDAPVGRIEVTHFSGMMSVAEKSNVLGRIDKLLRAVKKARQRANTAEVVDMHVGKALFEFIHPEA
jgi:hypothetical protein